MRMRKKKNAEKRIQACADFMEWRSMFEKNKPVHLEIGCGKGNFVCAMAKKFPGINFVAVEKITDVVVMAAEKAKGENLPNVRFLISDAKNLADLFEAGTISEIYLNFSDPWHKRYQKGKRLSSAAFLEIYKKIAKPGAKVMLKTDNRAFFDFSAKSFFENGFAVEKKSYDLYESDFFDPDNNIQTEYEKIFVSQNVPICYLEAIAGEGKNG
ncbi:MAG: tRNA (guanosine(46)-N7)-methyltransferase TrmB [Oscillospiraceae bacterium]|nr:tRNA (guanosine(46)-N7)-methyltransferase TrmB [Oscillospiraceae bacterium]